MLIAEGALAEAENEVNKKTKYGFHGGGDSGGGTLTMSLWAFQFIDVKASILNNTFRSGLMVSNQLASFRHRIGRVRCLIRVL